VGGHASLSGARLDLKSGIDVGADEEHRSLIMEALLILFNFVATGVILIWAAGAERRGEKGGHSGLLAYGNKIFDKLPRETVRKYRRK
jgi:hypothetical protein